MSDTKSRSGELLDARYRIERTLGRGSQGVTYLARDERTGERVVVKELDVGAVEDWKAIELFEREAKALSVLDHPRIPSYVASFHTQEDGTESFFLVQQFVDGEGLDAFIARGARVTEERAKEMARQLFEIARYIHGLEPPVIHRDIKPSNILRAPDGELWLVDFGAVQTLNPSATGGSTVVGTTGYMPAEQLMGRAVPATDLYAIGATLVHLLSHTHPSEMEMEFMKLQFHEHVSVSAALTEVLDDLLEPHVEKRIASAEEALRRLSGARRPQALAPAAPAPPTTPSNPKGVGWRELAQMAAHAQLHRREWQRPFYEGEPAVLPEGSKLRLNRDGEGLRLDVPANISRSPTALMALIWNGIVSIMFCIGLVAHSNIVAQFVWLGFLSLFGLVGFFLIYTALKEKFEETTISMTPDNVTITSSVFGLRSTRVLERHAIESIDFHSPSSTNGKADWQVVLETRDTPVKMLKSAPKSDQVYLASLIRDWKNGELRGDDSKGVAFDFSSGTASSEARAEVEEVSQGW